MQKQGKGKSIKFPRWPCCTHESHLEHNFLLYHKDQETCEYAQRTNTKAKAHDCHKNQVDSSETMQPVSPVELLKFVSKYVIGYSTYRGDDYWKPKLCIHQQVPYVIERTSNIIHIKPSLTTKLYNICKMAQIKKSSKLSWKVIEYLVISVFQNKRDPNAMKCIFWNALFNIP